jgi:hypothetical protein
MPLTSDLFVVNRRRTGPAPVLPAACSPRRQVASDPFVAP